MPATRLFPEESTPWGCLFETWDEAKHPRDRGRFAEKSGDDSLPAGAKPEPPPGSNSVTRASRVGVPGGQVPERVPTLPNLTDAERAVESRFREAYERDPAAMANQYRSRLADRTLGAGPNVFGTDDAKQLSPDYEASPENRSEYNIVLHQTANAIAKRAFMQHLDEVVAKMPEDVRSIVVTAGGCASGKDFAIRANPHTQGLASTAAAIWNAAGEQNSTEMEWVLQEAQARKIPAHFIYVHSDPQSAWTDPRRGVLARAGRRGRMIDAMLFAESYALGARNFQDFYERHRGDAQFTFLDAGDNHPRAVSGIPPEALRQDAAQIYRRAVDELKRSDVPPAIQRGGLIGQRLWGLAA